MAIGGLGINSLRALESFADELPNSERMPALFLGHGSPMNAIEENQFVRGFRDAAKSIPRPKAILCVSAHWFTAGTKVTAMKSPRTIHDFGGFPRKLFEVEYPAPGSPELATATAGLLDPVKVELDQAWGLDHGAWSVAIHMYPDADVPLIQLSIDRRLSPRQHFELASQLETLRRRGVLILGSGNIVHNLSLVSFRGAQGSDYGFDWAVEARQFVNGCIRKGDYAPLMDYQKQGRSMQLAVPTPEHYLPLLYILGLEHDPEKHELFNDDMVAGSLSMTSLKVA